MVNPFGEKDRYLDLCELNCIQKIHYFAAAVFLRRNSSTLLLAIRRSTLAVSFVLESFK